MSLAEQIKLRTVIDGEVRVRAVVPGDPKAKARPRFYQGHAVTPEQTRQAERAMKAGLYNALTVKGPDDDAAFALVLRFFTANWQRRDLDNMIKLVLDAATGIVWKDDSQVVRITADLKRAQPDPRTEVLITTVDEPLFATVNCPTCGRPTRIYPGHRSMRKFCSRECQHLSMRRAMEDLPCARCGKRVHTSKVVVRGKKYCSVECRRLDSLDARACAWCGTVFERERWRFRGARPVYCQTSCSVAAAKARRLTTRAGLGTCVDCGGPTSKRQYVRCNACRLTHIASVALVTEEL